MTVSFRLNTKDESIYSVIQWNYDYQTKTAKPEGLGKIDIWAETIPEEILSRLDVVERGDLEAWLKATREGKEIRHIHEQLMLVEPLSRDLIAGVQRGTWEAEELTYMIPLLDKALRALRRAQKKVNTP